ncbi:hypothetical protein OUZ56_015611 [Daphnia magna]|uniref:Uncharacterized protein n=1 Tax=Daphnia magna TaxID=35525 RepID=A0ABR0ANB0_9CRUS|nr:hypothetical protein OUZ56_015611 [Daphnia magna]
MSTKEQRQTQLTIHISRPKKVWLVQFGQVICIFRKLFTDYTECYQNMNSHANAKPDSKKNQSSNKPENQVKTSSAAVFTVWNKSDKSKPSPNSKAISTKTVFSHSLSHRSFTGLF